MKKKKLLVILPFLLTVACGNPNESPNGNTKTTERVKTVEVEKVVFVPTKPPTTKLIVKACQKDADCTEAGRTKCVNIDGFAVCASPCSATGRCGETNQECNEVSSIENPATMSKVCVKKERYMLEGQTCSVDVPCDTGLYCVHDATEYQDSDVYGVCRRLKKCDKHEECSSSSDPYTQCVYIRLADRSEVHACGRCNGRGNHCDYSKEICVSEPYGGKFEEGLCKKICKNNSECNAPQTCTKRQLSTIGLFQPPKVCADATLVESGSSCSPKGTPAKKCAEGLVCHPSTPADLTAGIGTCKIKCSKKTTKPEGLQSECGYGMICAEGDIIDANGNPTRELLCSSSPTVTPTQVTTIDADCSADQDWDYDHVCITDIRYAKKGKLKAACSTYKPCTAPEKCIYVDLLANVIHRSAPSMSSAGSRQGYCGQ